MGGRARSTPGLLHHSDRGSQYASHDYLARLQAAQVRVSMSRTGNCYDNALMESFWGALQTKLVEEQPHASHAGARHDSFLYSQGFYWLYAQFQDGRWAEQPVPQSALSGS